MDVGTWVDPNRYVDMRPQRDMRPRLWLLKGEDREKYTTNPDDPSAGYMEIRERVKPAERGIVARTIGDAVRVAERRWPEFVVASAEERGPVDGSDTDDRG